MIHETCGYLSLNLSGDHIRGYSPRWRFTTFNIKKAEGVAALFQGDVTSSRAVADRSELYEVSSTAPDILVTSLGVWNSPLSFRLARAQNLGTLTLQAESSNLRSVLQQDFINAASADDAESPVFRLEMKQALFTTLTGRSVLFFRPALIQVSE